MAMWNPGITRANAQPPGGRSSIMFNDGSDTRLRHSRPMGGLGEGYFGGHIHRTAPGVRKLDSQPVPLALSTLHTLLRGARSNPPIPAGAEQHRVRRHHIAQERC